MQDPLLSLPPEVLLQVCSLLPAADLARLTELSRGWRRFIADADESLWRDAEVNMSRLSLDVKPTPGALRALIRAPCLGVLRLPVEPSWANWGRKQQCRLHPKLEWALGRVRKVRSLQGADCRQQAFVQLLLRVAPHLQELQVSNASFANMQAVSRMGSLRSLHVVHDFGYEPWRVFPPLPRTLESLSLDMCTLEYFRMLRSSLPSLRRLTILGRLEIRDDEDVVLPPLLEEVALEGQVRLSLVKALQHLPALRRLDLSGNWRGPGGTDPGKLDYATAVRWPPWAPRPAGHCGLRWLKATLMWGYKELSSPKNVLSLIRANADTLEELVILNDDHDSDWLGRKLRGCGRLASLRRLKLERGFMDCVASAAVLERCRRQLPAVRAALRAPADAVVECGSCGCRESQPAGGPAGGEGEGAVVAQDEDSASDDDDSDDSDGLDEDDSDDSDEDSDSYDGW